MNLVAKLRFFTQTPMQRDEVIPAEKFNKEKNIQIHTNKENFVSHSIRRSLY